MNIQEKLIAITKHEVRDINLPNLRCITAFWKEPTVCISFYFDGEISEENKDIATNYCTYIISHFSNEFLEENYILWDYPKELPTEFIVYKRKE